MVERPAGVPVTEAERIESLDVLRGVAVLGILLLNILGFGLHSSGYSNPMVGVGDDVALGLGIWASVDILFEGAMRALFSMLFGAGVVLFTASKEAALHFRRNFWLLVFGLVDGYLLLWNGDILMIYAVAGALLYFVRDASTRSLLFAAGMLIVLMSAWNAMSGAALDAARDAAIAVQAGGSDQATVEAARQWQQFETTFYPSDTDGELAARRDSYASVFAFNAASLTADLVFVFPVVLLPDALAMMLLGMALYRLGVFDASRTTAFYLRLMVIGFVTGLAINGYEVRQAIASDFDPLVVFAYTKWSYHLGRLGMAAGYLGLVMLICKVAWLPATRAAMAAVGRMALTNYLMHSAIALVLFTGAGFALVGTLDRGSLYLIVLAIWAFQIVVSRWWLARYRFGPVEWVWRGLTYGRWPENRRT